VRELRTPVVVACALFVACCSLPWVGLWDPNGIADTGLYSLYGGRMADGLIPYRQFFVEYPPGALVALVLPALPGGHYAMWFKLEQLVFGLGTMVCLGSILSSLGCTRRTAWTALGIAAVTPALLGPIAINAFDFWPALLTTGALAALLRDRRRLAFALFGCATAAKLFPAALLPVLLLYVVRRYGRERLRECVVAYGAAVAVFFVPFAIAAPGGIWFSTRVQLQRGLQLESLGASLLVAAHHLGLYHVAYTPNLPYAQLSGALATAVGAITSVVLAAAVVYVFARFRRTDATGADLVLAATATLTAVIVFAKVLSPQYLVWLVPLVAASWTRTRWAAVLLPALALTQIWVPDRFRALQSLEWPTWVLLARNLVLVALLAGLVAAIRTPRTVPPPAHP
jgi:uncharacterized membrane protein